MKIHHLRNATLVIETDSDFILVDPMLGEVGTIPPFAYLKYKMQKNPLVPLPENASELLRQVTHCLVTHSQKWGIEPLTHLDHFDKAGREFLKTNYIPVATLERDVKYMNKHGIGVSVALDYWNPQPFLGGQVTAVRAQHGHSWMHRLMVNGAGFFVELPHEPSIYISGDTVYIDDVDRVLNELKPDIAVVAAGQATLDVGGPILMDVDEVVRFVEAAPGLVIANHMEALNHCPTTRKMLQEVLESKNLMEKVWIPQDGDVYEYPAKS